MDEFLKEAGAKYPVALDTDRILYNAYKVGPIPDMAFIKNGTIVFHDHPARLSEEDMVALIQGD